MTVCVGAQTMRRQREQIACTYEPHFYMDASFVPPQSIMAASTFARCETPIRRFGSAIFNALCGNRHGQVKKGRPRGRPFP